MKQSEKQRLAVIAKLATRGEQTADQLAVDVPGAINVSSDFYDVLRDLERDGAIQKVQNGRRAAEYALAEELTPEV